jgi:hypothetical protein
MTNITGNLEAAAQRDFERPMAQAVRHELFTEALLAAAHSRLEELKTASMNGSR